MKKDRTSGIPSKATVREQRVDVALTAGAVAGAAVGSIAGPLGTLAGVVIGSAAGVLAGEALADDAERRHAHAADLDDEIGVTSGDLGAATPDQPPARIGAFSAGSAGASTTHVTPGEGPFQDVDD